MESTLPQTAATVLINVSLAWITGVLASRFWLKKRAALWQEAVGKLLSAAMVGGLIACTAGILLSLWSESAAMGDVPWLDAWPACKEMLISTHYGHVGIAATAILTAALFAHWRFSSRGTEARYLGTMAASVFLIAAARVAIGHAFEQGLWSTALWVEWLHVVFMSLWAGVVFVAGWAVLPRVLANESFPSRERAAYLTPMSDWAAAALAVILATGIYNAFRVLSSPRDLIDADYGHILVFKITFVVVAIALGGFNRFFGLPAALSSDASPAQSRRGLWTVIVVLRIESIALFLVLAAAAVMINSAPPGQ